MNTLPTQDRLPILYQRFLKNVRAIPTSLAVIDDASGTKLTYAELLDDASKLAARLVLATPDLQPEEPICILMPRCVGQVLAQLAVLQCNACCVPIDPEIPLQRQEAMMERLRVRVVLLLDSEAPSGIQVQPRRIESISPSFPEAHPEQATHIIHTSGSTGPPKAVQVLEKGLLRLVENDHFTFQQDDRVAHLCASSFDISLFEVWCTFLSGATLVIISPEVTRNPSVLFSTFRKHQVSVAALPTALFNVVSHALPQSFNSLRWVVFAGEAANLQAVKSVLEVAPTTLSLFNCYGLTECSVFSLCYKVDPKDIQEDNVLPIGVAYDKATLFRVMDDSSRDVPGPAMGELYIGGDSVARGYRNQPDITKQKFVMIDGIKWYRTGDQVQWRDGVVGGPLDYVGRLDNQVKLRGLRFELEEIDNAILGHGSVAACTTVLMKVAHAEPFLVAFIIIKDDIPPSAVEEGLLIRLRTILPAYMIPRLHRRAELPLTPNGKVDRQTLSTSYLDRVIGPQIQSTLVSVNDPAALLTRIWQEVLAVPSIDPESNLFLLGASSISVVTVSYRFRKASGRELPVKTIYEYPSIRQLADVIPEHQTSTVEDGTSTSHSIVDILLEDSKIADSIAPTSPVNCTDAAGVTQNVVFITGVTGFLGVYMLSDLLQNPEIKLVYALVRANNESVAIKRVQHALQRYHLLDSALPCLSKLHVIPGCLEDDMFGLSDTLYQELVQKVQIIYHLGAKVNYTEPYSLHRPANVIGTQNIIQFAATSPLKPLHYVSSIAAYGPVGLSQPSSYLAEEADLHLYLENMQFDIGYSQGQWVAEEMVRRAIGRGIPACVYRPGHILGGRPRYLGNTEDFVYRLVQGCLAIGAWPHLPNQSKLFVPVDYTATTILRISLTPKAIGCCFNIVPPEDEQSSHVDMLGLYEILRENGAEMDMLPYAQWVERLERSAKPEINRLFAVFLMLKNPAYHDGRTAWEVYANMPTYGTKNTEWALHQRGSSFSFPMLDGAYFMKCFSHIAGLTH